MSQYTNRRGESRGKENKSKIVLRRTVLETFPEATRERLEGQHEPAEHSGVLALVAIDPRPCCWALIRCTQIVPAALQPRQRIGPRGNHRLVGGA